MEKTRSKNPFLRVFCPRCKKGQILFGKASLECRCKECNYKLADSTGGKARVHAPIRRVLKKN